MDLAEYRRVNNIIEWDITNATYKYVLLQGIIEICQQPSYLPARHLLYATKVQASQTRGNTPQTSPQQIIPIHRNQPHSGPTHPERPQ